MLQALSRWLLPSEDFPSVNVASPPGNPAVVMGENNLMEAPGISNNFPELRQSHPDETAFAVAGAHMIRGLLKCAGMPMAKLSSATTRTL